MSLNEKIAVNNIIVRTGASPDQLADGSYVLFNGKRFYIKNSNVVFVEKPDLQVTYSFNIKDLTGFEPDRWLVLVCGSVINVLIIPVGVAGELWTSGEDKPLIVQYSYGCWSVNEENVSEYLNRFDFLTGEKYWFEPNMAEPLTGECIMCGKHLRAVFQPQWYIKTTALNKDFWQKYYHCYQIGLILDNVNIGPPGDIYGNVCETCAWCSPPERMARIGRYLEALRQERLMLPQYWTGDNGELEYKLEQIDGKIRFLEDIRGT